MTARLARVLPAAIPPAVVVAVDPWGWYPFGPLRWLVTAASLLGCTAVALASGSSGGQMTRSLRAWVVALVAAMGVGAAFGVDDLYAWTGTPERNAGALMWALCALALALGASCGGGSLLVGGLVAAGAALGAAAVPEALGWEPALFDLGSRLTGLMGSSAYLGAAAALFLPVAVGVAASRSRRPVRLVAAAVAASLAVALVGSGARAAWVGVVAAGLLVLLTRWRSVAPMASAVHPAAVGVVAAAALVAVAMVVVLTPAGGRAASLLDRDSPGGAGRIDEWRVAARVLAAHPLTGVGPEGYRIAFPEGVDAAYQNRHGRDPLPDRAHSGPLDVALAGGPLGLVAWLGAWAEVGRAVLRSVRSRGAVDVGVAAGLVAHWVGQLFLFPLAELEPVAWLAAGWLVARACGSERPGRSAGAVERWRHPAAVAFAGFAVCAVLFGAVGVAADRQAGRAAGAGSLDDPVAASAALRAAERAVALRPDVVRHHLLLARVRVGSGEGFASALAAVDGALAVSPRDPVARLARAEYLVDRAMATEVPQHADEARREVWSLLAEDPLNTRAWALAVVLAASGT